MGTFWIIKNKSVFIKNRKMEDPNVKDYKDMTPEEKAAQIDKEEDEYFDQLMTAMRNAPLPEGEEEDDVAYFANHPLNCKEITPEMMEKPEFAALANLAYEGTPEEVCKNFKEQALESLETVIMK